MGLTLKSDVGGATLGEVMLDLGAGNVDRELEDLVFLHLRSKQKVIKAIMMRPTPPATPPAIAATFVLDPVEVGGTAVDDADRRDDSVPLLC